jgi:hypothetical protein
MLVQTLPLIKRNRLPPMPFLLLLQVKTNKEVAK